ncbi:MAG: hypothetical protein H7Y01_07485 [Ferruginibacter sp.]|nr:hypothetical protein [Chitinophagaceae bacterium]
MRGIFTQTYQLCPDNHSNNGYFAGQKSAVLEYLLFVVWLVLFAWIVTKVKFFTRTGLSQPQLIIIFLLKIMAGIFYGWIGLYYGGLAQMQDTWGFHTYSIQEYHLLFDQPREYFTNLFRDPYEGGVSKFFETTDSYWNDLKGNFFIKILSVLNIFSTGYYYVNVIFYSFITLFGAIAIYRVMSDVFPGRKMAILLATFLVPSFLYWTSGIHKEGLIFTGISLIVYCIYFGTKEKKFGFKRVLCLLAGLLLILALRNFLFIILVPAIIAWLIANRHPKYGLAIFSSLYLLFGILFFTARYINPKLDFPQAVVNKQQEFKNLRIGGSTIPMKDLEPTAVSFLKNTPQAINLSTIRPYPSDVKHILSLAAAIEINVLLLLFILFLFWRTNGNSSKSNNFRYFCVFFSLTVLLAIGFSVNNLGAIVRYRSVIMPLLVIPMAAQINWERLGSLLFKNIRNKSNVTKSA